ncbi:MAG: SUMF1/EgtB/PvdO family nonheme iron enzyme [Planctomycetes bacterium]|nr:SUMF1/EgtB/PvdO family nonheme iron enzyme [Planctomycetota bacterium]
MTLAASPTLPGDLLRELEPLRQALARRGAVMPVVGAGLSVPLRPCAAADRLPTWRGLLEELIAKAPPTEQVELARGLESGDFPLVASELVHHLGRGEVSSFIESRFAQPRFERPSVYDALVALPIDHFLTTNYDPFLGDAWVAHHRRAPNVVTPRDPGVLGNLRFDAAPFVLMLHGDGRRPQTCVLSAEDFAGLQFGTLGYSAALAGLAMQRRLLFLGHSLSDPDLSSILRECRTYAGEGAPLAHWFLGVDISSARKRQLAAHGVKAIEIATNGRFDVLESVLHHLAQPIEPELAALIASTDSGMADGDEETQPMSAGALVEIDRNDQAPTFAVFSKAAERALANATPATRLQSRGPFPGLLPFEEKDEHFFCGREAETLDALAYFRSRPANGVRWVQIEGASGAGKSSLLRAGVLPAMKRGEVDGHSDGWRVALLKPGRRPLRALAERLFGALLDMSLSIDGIEERLRRYPDCLATMLDGEKRLPDGQQLVIAIDQFEELFTFFDEGSEAAQRDRVCFVDRLAEALVAPSRRVHLVTTVRRDYLEHFTKLPSLDDLLGRAHRVNLTPMRSEPLLWSIQEAARRAGLSWTPADLPRVIRDEADRQPGALASLGLLLSELWQKQNTRGDRELTEQDYKDLHGVTGVLALRADELLARLRTRTVGDRTWADGALTLLVAMVRRDRGGFDRRKPITRAEAVRYAGGGAVGENVLEALSGQAPRDWNGEWLPAPRLVVVRDDASTGAKQVDPLVEVAVEQLSRSWKTLDDAVAQRAQDMLWRDRLEGEARGWSETGRRVLDLVTGPKLAEYRKCGSEDPLAKEFLAECVKWRRVIRGSVAALVAASCVGLGWWGRQARLRSEANEVDARIVAELERLPEWEQRFESMRDELMWQVAMSQQPAERIDAWQAKADSVLAEFDDFVRRRQALQQEALVPSERWRFENAEKLVANLSELVEFVGTAMVTAQLHAMRVEVAVAAYGREEQERRWRDEVLPSLGSAPYEGVQLQPRYDLMPLRRRASERPLERVWEFLLLGTGAEPVRDDDQAPWRVDENSGVVVVLIPGGEFVMGAQSADPAKPNFDERADRSEQPHLVRLSPFYVAAHEFTNAQRCRLVGDELAADGPSPLVNVDWEDATQLSVGLVGKLPTEAQWEYACRAGTTSRYWSGDDESCLESVGWFAGNIEDVVHRVGELSANAWGLFDVHGNAWEWCSDWYGEYEPGELVDPLGPPTGSDRVIRGGGFRVDADGCRSAFRCWFRPVSRWNYLGFRVVLPAAPSSAP